MRLDKDQAFTIQPTEDPIPPEPARSSADKTYSSILIAEDDPIARHVLKNILVKANYNVVDVADGCKAWEILQQEHAPQLAILDWIMPGLNGVDVCRKVRTLTEGAYRYVLLLTSKSNKQDVIAGLEAGADDYLIKPFDADELRARLRVGQRILRLKSGLLEAQGKLKFEATHDALMGIWNRAAILDLMKREVKRAARTGAPIAVLMLDIDHFKAINDRFGHPAGDAILREVARRIASAIRAYDALGRYGGEEFLIVVPGCRGLQLVDYGERLRCAVADTSFDAADTPLSVTVSIGVAAADPIQCDSLPQEVLLNDADAALYRAKAKGRNRVEFAGIPT